MGQYEITTDKGTYLVETDDAPQTTVAPPAPKSLGGFASNALGSGLKVAGDVLKTAALPVTMAWDAAGQLKSGVENAVRATQPGFVPPPRANLGNTLGALGKGARDYVANRYGSLDALGNTLYTDPFGVAMDASAVAGGIGALMRGVGAAARMPPLARAGRALTTTADVLNPISAIPLVGAGINRVTAPARNKLATRFMGAALNPPVSLPPAKAADLVNTALTEGIPASAKGYRKAESLRGGVQSQVDSMVRQGEQLGVEVDPLKVASYVRSRPPQGLSTEETFANQVNPVSDVNAVDRVVAEYLAQHTPPQPAASGLFGPSGRPLPPPPAIPPQPYGVAQAQSEKVGTYRNLKDKAYTDGLKAADVTTQKSLAHGLRNEIADGLTAAGIPGINEANKREGKLIALMNELERVISKEQKTPPGQIAGPLWAGAAGGVVGGQVGMAGPVGAVAALLRYTATHPEFGSKIALAISSQSPQKYQGIRSVLSLLRQTTPVASRAINIADQSAPYSQPK